MSEQMTTDQQQALAEHQRAFQDAIKKAQKKYSEGKQYLWDAGDHAKQMKAIVAHGGWDDYCRGVIVKSRQWVASLIRFRDNYTREQAAFIGSVDDEVKQLGDVSNGMSTFHLTPEAEERVRKIKAHLHNAREAAREMAIKALVLKADIDAIGFVGDLPAELSLLWKRFPDKRTAINATAEELEAFAADYVDLVLDNVRKAG